MVISLKYGKLTYSRWLIGLLCAGTLASVGFFYADDSGSRKFSFNPDPGTRLLVVQSIGTMTGFGVSYTLYADGRLEIYRVNYQFEKTSAAMEYRLSFEEVNELVRSAVDGGLLDWDDEQIRREMQDVGGTAYVVNDGATMRLEINVESYQGIGEEDSVHASKLIVFDSPTVVAKRYPDIEELQAMADIYQQIRSYRQKAAEVIDEK